MERSKVYFTDFRTVLGVSLPAKLQKLIDTAKEAAAAGRPLPFDAAAPF